MPLHGLPNGAIVVGNIEIALYLSDEGDVRTAYGFDGVSEEAAVGHLTVVLDRIREERLLSWDTCPSCHLPWSEHDDPDDEDDYEDE